MIAAGIALLLIPIALAFVSLLVLVRRDDEELERTWRRLMSPEARRLRETVDSRVSTQKKMLSVTRGWARNARAAGDVEHAARLEREGRTLVERLQHKDLLIVKRMLSALRPR